MNTIFKRRSVRKFKEMAVENEKIELLLKAGMAAPSAGNQQPWEFYVVKDKDFLKKLAKASPYAGCIEKAPMAIVLCARNNISMPEYSNIDMSAAAENILLEAVELDLGAVWLGMAPIKERMERVREILALPDSLTAFAIIPIGYAFDSREAANRFDASRVHYV